MLLMSCTRRDRSSGSAYLYTDAHHSTSLHPPDIMKTSSYLTHCLAFDGLMSSGSQILPRTHKFNRRGEADQRDSVLMVVGDALTLSVELLWHEKGQDHPNFILKALRESESMSTAPRIAGTGESVSPHDAPNAVAWMPSTAIRGRRVCTTSRQEAVNKNSEKVRNSRMCQIFISSSSCSLFRTGKGASGGSGVVSIASFRLHIDIREREVLQMQHKEQMGAQSMDFSLITALR